MNRLKFAAVQGLFCVSALLCPSGQPVALAEVSDLSEIAKQLQTLQRQLSELQEVVSRQQDTITTLRSENQSLKSTTQPAAAPTSSAASSRPTRFNPDIGVVGTILGKSTQSSEDEEGNDRFSVQEIELILGHDIDPYSRFDSIITFSDFEEPGIEEAFVSYWGLPYDTKLRIGRFRPKVGIQSALHPELLETVDEPLVIQRYLGAEGLFKTGVELGNFLPFGWDNPAHELTVGMIEGGVGEGGELLGESRRVPTLYARLRNAAELSDFDHLSVGGTYLRGSSGTTYGEGVNLYIADISYTRQFDSVRRLKLQSEFFLQDRLSDGASSAEVELKGADDDDSGEPGLVGELRDNPYGMYALAEYRFAERFGVGGRFDYVQPVEVAGDGGRSFESAHNMFVTFFQSEFARWRFQYQYANLADGGHDNRFFLQGTFAIGVHKHSLQ